MSLGRFYMVYVSICMYVWVCICVYMSICAYVWGRCGHVYIYAEGVWFWWSSSCSPINQSNHTGSFRPLPPLKLPTHRSMITGQHGMTTLVAEAENPLREWDVLDFVKVGRRFLCLILHQSRQALSLLDMTCYHMYVHAFTRRASFACLLRSPD